MTYKSMNPYMNNIAWHRMAFLPSEHHTHTVSQVTSSHVSGTKPRKPSPSTSTASAKVCLHAKPMLYWCKCERIWLYYGCRCKNVHIYIWHDTSAHNYHTCSSLPCMSWCCYTLFHWCLILYTSCYMLQVWHGRESRTLIWCLHSTGTVLFMRYLLE